MHCARVCIAILVVAGCAEPTTTPTTQASARQQPGILASNQNTPATVFNVQLLAENEPNGASTSESKGQAQVKVYQDGTMEFLFTINNKADETYTRAHIHKAAAGTNGPIHWDFLEAGNPVPNLTGQPPQLRGVARARAAAVIADLLANPANYYVNVHSTAFPGGSIRGQLE